MTELAKTKPSTGLLYSLDEDEDESTESGRTTPVETWLLEIGDHLLVPVGASPPLDGIVTSASPSTSFNEASMTGESRPVLKAAGDSVLAGTTNAGPSAVIIQVSKEPGTTVLDGIIQSVREAMGRKASIELLADVITGYFTPAVTAISLITFIVWFIRGVVHDLPLSWLDGKAESTGNWLLVSSRKL